MTNINSSLIKKKNYLYYYFVNIGNRLRYIHWENLYTRGVFKIFLAKTLNKLYFKNCEER